MRTGLGRGRRRGLCLAVELWKCKGMQCQATATRHSIAPPPDSFRCGVRNIFGRPTPRKARLSSS